MRWLTTVLSQVGGTFIPAATSFVVASCGATGLPDAACMNVPRRRCSFKTPFRFLALLCCWIVSGAGHAQDAPRRLDSLRFTIVYYPRDERLAHSILSSAVRTDSFPGLPRPRDRALIAIAPDSRTFREWAGIGAPEWGAALAFPDSKRIVMHGSRGAGDAGDPIEIIRHELAHLALHEYLGNLPPRWFDEGYASVSAAEWRRDDVLAANVGLALRGTPTLDQLDDGFRKGALSAQASYSLSYRAVTELASLDAERGLSLFFRYWHDSQSLDAAIRQAFGITLDGFEKIFRDRTRHRYGGLAVLADFSIVGLIVCVLALPFFFIRRVRDRRRLKKMLIADDVTEKAESEKALAELKATMPIGTDEIIEP